MQKIIIGIQGGEGSTNERACKIFAQKFGWQNFEIKYLITSENVLKELNEGLIDFGTFAWSSIGAGLVEETQNAIKKYTFEKVDEVELQLDHALFYKEKIDKEKLVKVYSHPQALKIHQSYLKEEFSNLQMLPDEDTALSVKKLSLGQYEENAMAIGPVTCKELYSGVLIYNPDLPTNHNYLTTLYLIKKS